MPNDRAHLWNERLKLVSYCPLCETRSRPAEVRLLGEDGETHLLHMTCRKCQGSVLALVLVNRVGASSVGVVTDLLFDDVVRCGSRSALSADDVLEAHELVQKPLARWGLPPKAALPLVQRPRRAPGSSRGARRGGGLARPKLG